MGFDTNFDTNQEEEPRLDSNKDKVEIYLLKNKKAIKSFLIFFVASILSLVFVFAIIYFFLPRDNGDNGNEISYLPGDLSGVDKVDDDEYFNGLKAEELMFGHFYNEIKDSYRPSLLSYDLPIDVKADAENYYEVSRKLDLDDYIEEINEHGFAVMKNSYSSDDFYSVYSNLIADEIPVMLTSDFLLYYYQNNLKNVYDEIERNTFYKNVWDIYSDLYLVASERYEKRLSKVGVSKDPILEAQRLETAYLAVILKLLSAEDNQISEKKSLGGDNYFTMTEAIYFNFEIPDYLEEDVNKELAFIRARAGIDRSPLFLYPRDYTAFEVPKILRSDAKLYNFYLARRWLNTVFPLYFRSSDCEECLLDENDWLVNTAAASYLAQDLSAQQKNKNKWAIIYKFISFFTGLRQDLTYLEYDRALKALYGEEYDIETIFNRENFGDIEIYKLQKEIISNKFSEIEGSYTRSAGENPKIGMRMLQEEYWPNEYIFENLSGEEMTTKASNSKEKRAQSTLCSSRRCIGTAMDIFAIHNNLSDNDDYYPETNYNGYEYAMKEVKNIFAGFNVFTWNTNFYWSTLDILNKSLTEDMVSYPVFMKDRYYFNNKALVTSLGAWANIHLDKDEFTVKTNVVSEDEYLRPVCDLSNFVEPNLTLLNEMISRNNMVLEMMDVLNVSRDTNLAALDIKEVNTSFEQIKKIEQKILSGKLLDYSDCIYLRTMVNNTAITTDNSKYFYITVGKKTMNESIDGMKLMLAVFGSGDNMVIAVGPMFNYNEF